MIKQSILLKENIKAYIAWFNVSIIWGTTYLAIRVGVGELPPLLFAGFRWIIAGSFFFLYLLIRGHKLPRGKEFFHLGVIGICLLGIGNGLVVFGEQWVPSGIAALLITTLPFWIVGMESLVPSSPKKNYKIYVGLIFGLLGVFLIFGNSLENLWNKAYLIGMLSLLTAVVSWSFGSVYSKYVKLKTSLLMGASIQMLFAGILQTSIGLMLGELPKFHLHSDGLLAFAYLIVVGSFIGYSSYTYAIANLPLSFVSTYAYINPIIALFLGWLVLDEQLNITTIIAAIIIFIGVAIVKSGSYSATLQKIKNKTRPEDKTR